jgi:hypothetical protein
MSYSYLSSEPYDFTSHVTDNLTGRMHKIPRVYRACYGVTGQIPPGDTPVGILSLCRPYGGFAGKRGPKGNYVNRSRAGQGQT